jgi:hypothetical protein
MYCRMRYTQALIRSVPSLPDPPHTRLRAISGRPPDMLQSNRVPLQPTLRLRDRRVPVRSAIALTVGLCGQNASLCLLAFRRRAGGVFPLLSVDNFSARGSILGA